MSDREQKEPLLKRPPMAPPASSSTGGGRPATAPLSPGAFGGAAAEATTATAATSASDLDVEKAESANIRSIEQRQGQSPLLPNVFQRTADSLLRMYPTPGQPQQQSVATAAAGIGGSALRSPKGQKETRKGSAASTSSSSKDRWRRALKRPGTVRRGASAASAAASSIAGPRREQLREALSASILAKPEARAGGLGGGAAGGASQGDGEDKPPSLRAVARHVQIANAWSRPHMFDDDDAVAGSLPPAVAASGGGGAGGGRHRRAGSAAEILESMRPVDDQPIFFLHPDYADLDDDDDDDDDDLPSSTFDGVDDDSDDASGDLLREQQDPPQRATYGTIGGGDVTHSRHNRHDAGDDNNDDASSFLFDDDEDINTRSQQYTLSRRLQRHSRTSFLPCLNFRVRPMAVVRRSAEAIVKSTVLWVSVPLFLTALALYYPLGNPKLDFLPGEATVSWWCNFIGRQLLMMELARLTSYLLMDFLVMTRFGARLLGSHVTFFCLQGAGWPSVLAFWGVWDLLLLHGDNRFQTHWLYWTRWRIYSVANSGRYIMASNLYLRTLLAMIFLGAATAVKRTVLAMRFGNRQLAEFKPRLEKILQDAIIVSEVAVLAYEAALLVIEESPSTEALDVLRKANLSITTGGEGSSSPSKAVPRIRFGSVSFEKQDPIEADENSSNASGKASHSGRTVDRPVGEVRFSELTQDPAPFFAPGDDVGKPTDQPTVGPAQAAAPRRHPALSRTESGNFRIKETLERWDEPVTKSEKNDASIRDILRFQRVLQSIDATYPFGEEFGPCKTRNDCIDSAHSVYWKLMALSPDSASLPFETIALGAIGVDGLLDEAKHSAYNRVFRPDANNRLPLSYFIQSIDTVFKHLLFFRASVRNNSVIDNVLESTINGLFYFVVSLLLLSFMQINPWPLLVSLTSLLVSVSFALGSSVSKYVEGLLLITVRRPFDLGDRIIILPSEATDNPGSTYSWFVEDINLFSTTLRFARTNEVATVSNSSISASRIINCNRSAKAIVFFDFMTKISILDGDKFQRFSAQLTDFVRDHPRTWESLLFVRKVEIDSDAEFVRFNIGFRHRSSWQDAARIMLNRGDLLAHVYHVARVLGIAYDSPPNRRVLYTAGTLVSGQVADYKSNLFSPTNIINHDQESSAWDGRARAMTHQSSGSGRFEALLDAPMQG